ncbi:MAG: hypothetical protein ABJQ14_00895 [Hyphomicrobiales bacterium]
MANEHDTLEILGSLSPLAGTHFSSGDMAPFPYMPMLAIMASLVGQQVVQMSVFAYAPFMVEYLGVVDDKDEAGEI